MQRRDGSGWKLSNSIPVLEIFGPTIQGEGMVIGKKTMFVRTAGCDYSCEWCDSAFTWDGSAKEEIVQMKAEEVWDELNNLAHGNFSHVTISGGNPALLKNLKQLITIFNENNVDVAIETQGSVWQDWFLDVNDLTISPKPPSSKMKTNYDALDSIITRLTEEGRQQHTSLKVVVFDEVDFAYAKEITKRYPHISFYLQVGNEDIDTTNNQLLAEDLFKKYQWLIDRTLDDEELNDARVLPQLHTLLWGNKRGV
ncbi:7-carboxy-7-deazaguanine synthase QueE [Salipaludibacillus daqingensis]|uniref:7-carboxy-7-deazaguanine synthase QueE n=1 Tax=Salipaludibacillus daqingensis TaxID=3041001 RepID=UPI002474AA42|nr:7-carboxy-7-deazaguanine synthase QueE [Salipaludibacillus daqingensis]